MQAAYLISQEGREELPWRERESIYLGGRERGKNKNIKI